MTDPLAQLKLLIALTFSLSISGVEANALPSPRDWISYCIAALTGGNPPDRASEAEVRSQAPRTLSILGQRNRRDLVRLNPLSRQTPLWKLAMQSNGPQDKEFSAAFFDGRMTNDAVRGTQPVRSEIEYLLNDFQYPNQLRMAMHWEAFCAALNQKTLGSWAAIRFFGTDGSYGYYGRGGYATVFTPDHKIYYIQEFDPELIDKQNMWDVDLRGWTQQIKGFR